MNIYRDWMYRRNDSDGFITIEFMTGLDDFIAFACSHLECMNGTKIRCPCIRKKCRNRAYLEVEEVKLHLLEKGFINDYFCWNMHGEQFELQQNLGNDIPMMQDNYDPYRRMVMDAAGPSVFPEYFYGGSSYDPPTYTGGPSYNNTDYEFPSFDSTRDDGPRLEEQPNPEAQKWYDMLKASEQELWSGSSLTQLSAVARMLNIKSDHRLSERAYDDICSFVKEALPEDNTMTDSFYETKKLLSELGLPVEKIHCCERGCMLYWREDSELDKCKLCKLSRYKESNGRSKVPRSRMYYLPLTPRLQRLYASEYTASDMTWHATHEIDDGAMMHPSDSEAWKKFDRLHPDFAAETRNIRLGLCTDGFAPFGAFAKQFSSWPVIVTPYNLPPSLCMKEQFMFLTILIPGPTNPKQRLDVYLQPLIAELQELWKYGVATYDISTRQNFLMRAALMWTISDFPAYSMLSGWTCAGKLACPNCMETSDAFQLKNGHKTSWFDNTRKHLPKNHAFRKDESGFLKGKKVKKVAPKLVRDGHKTLNDIESRGFVKITEKGGKEINDRISRDPRCGWKKKSIFWDLPYWSSNLIRHNLDVMHIEKNVFDNLFNTIMSVEKRTKDNTNSRKDVKILCDRDELEIDPETGKYPLACYQLLPDEKEALCQWVTSLKFPDGYVSNLSRNVDLRKGKIFGMKSHDAHVFMQRLLPLALRELRPNFVWEAITELSLFFKELTSRTLTVDDMARLEKEIPIILCKLERIFPPSFFDSMEHLPVHLAYEARLAGPVQYRWMYRFERFLYHLKKMVKNKSRVEGSITNSYLTEEASNFCSHYFEDHVYTRSRKVSRNDDGGEQEEDEDNLDVFKKQGRAWGKCKYRYLEGREILAAQSYILQNCSKVRIHVDLYKSGLRSMDENMTEQEIDKKVDDDFPYWFQDYACGHDSYETGIYNQYIKDLASFPLAKVESYPVYFVNGYKFHTRRYGEKKATANSGVCVYGTTYADLSHDYYGILEEILILEYPREPIKKVVLFKCSWFDPTPKKGTRIQKKYKLVDVNRKMRLQKYEPFVLAYQADQVCFIPYPTGETRYHWKYNPHDWLAVCKIKARSTIDMSAISQDESADEDAFQNDIPSGNPIAYDNDDNFPRNLRDPTGNLVDIYDGDTDSEEDIIIHSSDSDRDFYQEPDD